MHHEAVEEHFSVFGSNYSNTMEVFVIGSEECFLGALKCLLNYIKKGGVS